MMIFVLIMIVHFASAKWEESCELKDTVNISDAGTGGYRDENLNYDYKGITFSSQTFGNSNKVYADFSNVTKAKDHLRGCICKYKPCIRLCYYGDNFNETVDELKFKNFNVNLENFGIVRGLTCEYAFNVGENEIWSIMQNGSVSFQESLHNYDEYCIDDDLDELRVIICHKNQVETARNEFNQKLKRIGLLISLPFLIVTILIYGFLPQLHENVGDKCLMTYIASLFFHFIILFIRTFNLTDSPFLCTSIAYLIYFTTIFYFTWQNIMCFDIWKCTSTFQYSVTASSTGDEWKKYKNYCIYGFGAPIVIFIVVLLIDVTKLLPQDMSPGFGRRNCFLDINSFIYIHVPTFLFIIINVAFFIATTIKLARSQRNYSSLETHHSNFYLYLQLFVLMGVFWIFDIIQWLSEPHKPAFFIVTDFISFAQGFIIFIMCVCNTRVRKLIMERCGLSRRDESTTVRTNWMLDEPNSTNMIEMRRQKENI